MSIAASVSRQGARWVGALWGCVALSVHAQSASQPIPYKSTGTLESPPPQQWLLAVLVCIVALGVLLFFIRRHGGLLRTGGPTPGRRVHIVERVALPPHGQMVVVEYENRRLLLVVGPSHATCVRDDVIGEVKP